MCLTASLAYLATGCSSALPANLNHTRFFARYALDFAEIFIIPIPGLIIAFGTQSTRFLIFFNNFVPNCTTRVAIT